MTIGSFGVGVVLLVALVWNESDVAQPIMPLRLFADPVRRRDRREVVRLPVWGA